jgi:hypothetical protein
MVQTQNDSRMKTELEQALRLVEVQVGPPGMRTPAVTGAMMTEASGRQAPDNTLAPPAAPPMSAETSAIMSNPSEAYTDAVQRALVDAMLDYGHTLGLSGEEWLTVAARENSDAMLAGDLTDSVTITLRVKASDLEALKAGRLSRDEVRQRVEVNAF